MKLETTLIELSALVEYGTEYLLNRSKTWVDVVNTIEDEHPLDVLPYLNQDDILTYTIGEFSNKEILEEMASRGDGKSDILTYTIGISTLKEVIDELTDVWDVDEILDFIDESKIKDYAYENLHMINENDARDYVCENYDVADVYDDDEICQYVKDNFEADDMYDEEITEITQSMVEDMSLGEIMDIQGLTENDVLSTLKDGEIIDYVRDHFYPLDVFDDEPCLVGMCDKTILDYVKMNFDVKKVFDLVWEMADEDDWRDFVTNNFVPTDFIEWRVD